MVKKKNNHYVPAFYLKLWSHNKKQINSYLFKSDNPSSVCATIADETSKNYLYGKDGKVEDLFGELESAVSDIIEKHILPDTQEIDNLSDNDISMLKAFMSIGLHRTIWEKNQQDKNSDRIVKLLIDNAIAMGLDPPDLPADWKDCVEIKSNFPQLMKRELPLIVSCVQDLSLHFIPTDSPTSEFITSDNPVILLNPLAEKLEVSGGGLTSAGLSLLMPLTPKYALLAYDGSAYDINANVFTCENVNLAVCHNAVNCIYYKDIPIEEIQKLTKNRIEPNSLTRHISIEGKTYLQVSRPSLIPGTTFADGLTIKPELDLLSTYIKKDLDAPNKYVYSRKESELHLALFEGFESYAIDYIKQCDEKNVPIDEELLTIDAFINSDFFKKNSIIC